MRTIHINIPKFKKKKKKRRKKRCTVCEKDKIKKKIEKKNTKSYTEILQLNLFFKSF